MQKVESEMEPNAQPKDGDNKAQTLNTRVDGMTTIKAQQQDCKCVKESLYDKTLQKLGMMVTQQQQSMEEACQKLDNLTRMFQQFALYPNISRVSVNTYGFYKGWGLAHDIIMSHEYVARNDLLNILHKINHYFFRTVEGKKEIIKLLTSLKKYRVSEHERFPSGAGGAYYVDINSDSISRWIKSILQVCNDNGKNVAPGAKEKFNNNLESMRNTLVSSHLLHDRASFERQNALTWVTIK